MRARYGDFIASKYNSSEVYFRSTDVDRTKMSGLAAMAALYAPADGYSEWNPYLAWEPVPYTTLPVTEDYVSKFNNMFNIGCAQSLKTSYTLGMMDFIINGFLTMLFIVNVVIDVAKASGRYTRLCMKRILKYAQICCYL